MLLTGRLLRRQGILDMLRLIAVRHPGKASLSIGNLLLVGILEVIGIAALLPTLGMVLQSDQQRDTPIDKAFESFFEMTGLPTSIEAMLVLIVVVVTIKAAVRLLAMRQVAYASAHVAADNRLRLIQASMVARWDHFVSLSAGRLVNAISVEAERAGKVYNTACKLLAEAIQALAYMFVAVAISWQVTASSAAVGGLLMVILYALVNKTRLAGRAQTQAQTSFTARLIDGLAGMKPLKSMGGEERLAPLLTSDIRLLQRTAARLTMLSHYVRAIQEPMTVTALVGGVYVLLVILKFPIEALLVLALLFTRMVGNLNSVQRSMQNIASFEAAFWLVEDLTDKATRSREKMTGRRAAVFEHSIEFKDVDFGYDDHRILEKACLTISAGQFVTITGPSGVGKTTTADLIIGLFRPEAGKILIDGVDFAECDLAAWRRQIGYVPQETYLFHDTIAVNVTLGEASISDAAVKAALRQAGAWEFVQSLPNGIHTGVGEHGSRLSGGQRQRIAIARALVRAPKLLVLDESTTALDEATEAGIVSSLRAFAGTMTILAVSHQPAMVSAADKVFRVEGHKLHEVSAPLADIA